MSKSLTRAFVASMAATLLITGPAAAGRAAEPKLRTGPDAIKDSYLVVYEDDGAVSTLGVDAITERLATRYRAAVTHVYRHALRGFAATLTEAAARALADEPGVAYVEQNRVVRTTGTQRPVPSWGLDRIDQQQLPLDNSYTYANTGAGVVAYVIDTGIRITHSDFAGRAVWGTNTTGDGNNSDCHGHGTHVAGALGGNAHGVAKAVRLVAVKVLNCAGSGTFAGIAAGIDWVTGDHTSGPAVANMSLGATGSSATLETAVRNSIADGVVYTIAAGNSNADACHFTPARVPEAITVGAVAVNDTKASFSNHGTCVDVYAPGVNIASTWNTGDTATNTVSGTSMAAPHAAGVAAQVIFSISPQPQPNMVGVIIAGNAIPIPGLPGGGTIPLLSANITPIFAPTPH